MEVLQARTEKAGRLYARAGELAEELAATGEVEGLLAVMARLPDYDAENLLLIHEQFPRATFLASAAYWQAEAADPGHVLLPEWEGKGIDVVVPALVPGDDQAVVPFAVKVYDVRQVAGSHTLAAPAVTDGELESMRAALCSHLMRSDNEDAYGLSNGDIPDPIASSALYVLPEDPDGALLFAMLYSLCPGRPSQDDDYGTSYEEDDPEDEEPDEGPYDEPDEGPDDEPDEEPDDPDAPPEDGLDALAPYLVATAWLLARGLPAPALTAQGRDLVRDGLNVASLERVRARYADFSQLVDGILPER